MHELNITGTLREDSGGAYTFSVKAFKQWKRRFQEAYSREYGSPFRDAVPNPKEREVSYKAALGLGTTDVFQTGNVGYSIPVAIYDRVIRVGTILAKK